MSEEQTTQQPESINLSDLSALLEIVDIATTRGAFKGNELSQVGAVYDKLNVFLTFVAEQQAATAAQQETEKQAEPEEQAEA